MSGIATTLSIIDRMTAPIMSIDNAINSLVGGFKDVEAASNIDASTLENMKRQVEMAGFAAEQLNQQMEMEASIRQNEDAQRGFNSQIQQGSGLADGLTKKITGAVAAYASFKGIKGLLNLSDEMTLTTARLDMMNDGLQTTAELQDMIFRSAQRSRAAYQMTADVVSKLGTQAADAFSSNEELIGFAEQLNKSFVVAGTSVQGVESVMYNLTQALASGILRGQDLNAVMANAPNILQNVADYMGITMGEIRALAAEGELSAEVIKNAMLAAAQETDAKFESMPMTFGQVATSIQNQALAAFQPLLERINEIANSPAFQVFVNNAINAIVAVANAVMDIYGRISSVAEFVRNNWSVIQPIIYGVAAAFVAWKIATIAQTVAQWALNSAILANPLTWIVVAIGAVIAAIAAWVNKFGGLRASWLLVVNAIMVAWDMLKIGIKIGVNFILDFWDKMQLGMKAGVIAIQNFMGDMKAKVLMILQNMVNGAIDLINGFIGLLNKIPGVNIGLIEQVSFGTQAQLQNEAERQAREAGLADAAEEVRAAIAGRADELQAMKDGATAAMADRLAEIEAARAAANREDDAAPADAPDYAFADFGGAGGGISDIAGNTAAIAGNTSNMADFSEEQIKLWRDIAERDTVNRFTIAEVSVDFGGVTNNVASDMDLDGIVEYIGVHVEERLLEVAEGVNL